APAGRASVGMNRDGHIRVRPVPDPRSFVDARTPTVVRRASHHALRAGGLEYLLQTERDVEVVRSLRVAIIRRGPRRVARTGLRANEDGPRDLRAVRVVAAIVSGIDYDRSAGQGE